MSGPIVFDPTPAPAQSDACDGFDAFHDIASTVDANFAQLNGYFRSVPRVAYFSASQASDINAINGTQSSWEPLTWAWPACSFYVPDPCAAILVVMTVLLTAYSSSLVFLNAAISGDGISSSTPDPWMEARNLTFWGSNHALYHGGEVNPGGQVTITPQGQWYNAANAKITGGRFDVYTFSGAPR
jgi:hypothetical protein